MKKIQNYINGKIISRSKEYLDVIDPSTGEKNGEVVLSNSEDFNYAVKSAKNAFNDWSTTTSLKRSRVYQNIKI